MTGLSKAFLSRIGKYRVFPSTANLAKISRALDVPIGIFFGEDEADEKSYSIVSRGENRQTVPG